MGGRNGEAHHVVPRCLVSLHERANKDGELDGEAIQAWLEWEMEAMRWRVPMEIERADPEALVASSEAMLERESHRLLHSSDWRRWGSSGGRETLRRYGAGWFSLLALRRRGRITAGRPRGGEDAPVRPSRGEATSIAFEALQIAFNGRKGR